jgi:hypothetical protein
LNIQRDNLREVDRSVNAYNKDKVKGSSSKYYHVHLCRNKWRVTLYKNTEHIHCGIYEEELVAAWVANQAAELE